MELIAKNSREWRDRMAIILILFIGSAAWFFYDGLVAYPKYNVKADAYAELYKVYKDDKKILTEKWKECAIKNAWDIDEEPAHRKDEAQQIHWGSGLLIVSALFLLWMIREMRRVITADDEKFLGIKKAFPPFNSLVPVKFASVVGIDKHKWEKKGIAGIFYRDEAGMMKCVLVDDYKYAGSEKILERCEEIIAQKKAAKSTGTQVAQ